MHGNGEEGQESREASTDAPATAHSVTSATRKGNRTRQAGSGRHYGCSDGTYWRLYAGMQDRSRRGQLAAHTHSTNCTCFGCLYVQTPGAHTARSKQATVPQASSKWNRPTCPQGHDSRGCPPHYPRRSKDRQCHTRTNGCNRGCRPQQPGVQSQATLCYRCGDCHYSPPLPVL